MQRMLIRILVLNSGTVDMTCRSYLGSTILYGDRLTQTFAGGSTPFIYWQMIESSVGIIGACLPMLRPICTEYTVWSSIKTRLSSSWSRRLQSSDEEALSSPHT